MVQCRYRRRGPLRIFLWLIVSIFLAGCMGTHANLKEGKARAAAGDWDKSVQIFQKAYQENPDDPEIKLLLTKSKWNASLGHMAKGEEALKKGLYDVAVAEFQMSIAFFPGNNKAALLIDQAKAMKDSEYYTKQGHSLVRAQKVFQAREAFEKALDLNPNNLEARESLASLSKKEEPSPKYRLRLKSDEPISLKFKKTPIINVFEVLTKLTGVNFIFDKDLPETKVTLFMTDVSLDRFLEVLLGTNNLAAKVIDERTMVVYANTPAKAKEYNDLQIRTFYLANMDVKKAVGLLGKILKSKDIMANEELNAVVIRGERDVIELASRIIEANDRAPSEVMLNVELLEVRRTKEKQLGIDFNPMSVTLGVGEASMTVTKGASFVESASLYALDRLTNKNLLLSIPTATLNLLKQDTDTTVLANPQIRVKNGEKAQVLIGERVPLRVNRRVDTTGVVTNDYQYQDIGVKLEVEPSINVQDEISVKLTLEVSALGANIGTVDDPQYSILTRTAKSVLTSRDGEPIILGGLISDEERVTVRKVPGLGDVPILGRLFSNVDAQNVKTDILISITPIVMRSQEVPGSDVTRLWSGKEDDFSVREPYESRVQRKGFEEEPAKKKVEEAERIPPPPQPSGVPRPPLPTGVPPPPPPPTLPSPPGARPQGGGSSSVPGSSAVQGQSVAGAVPRSGPPGGATGVTQAVSRAQEASPSRPRPEGGQDLWPANLPYSIHVNSLTQKDGVERRIRELETMNYDCFVVPKEIPGRGLFYRIYVGRFKDRESAEILCDRLKERKEFQKDIHVVTREWAMGG